LTQGFKSTDDQAQRGSCAAKLRTIPDAPFRTSWPLQLFKRALRDAVADGKEWIGWTTGETQAARYDLSKQIDSITQYSTKMGLQGQPRMEKNRRRKIPEGKLADYWQRSHCQEAVDKGKTWQRRSETPIH
jgi:hypothetical protein